VRVNRVTRETRRWTRRAGSADCSSKPSQPSP
jgi:hypothetical protein